MADDQRAPCEGFVVWVDFELAPDAVEAFAALVQANAATSVEAEPGCRRFDVLRTAGGDRRVSLYEIYDDEAAFQTHLATAHFKDFDAASASMIVHKTIRTYFVRENAKP